MKEEIKRNELQIQAQMHVSIKASSINSHLAN